LVASKGAIQFDDPEIPALAQSFLRQYRTSKRPTKTPGMDCEISSIRFASVAEGARLREDRTLAMIPGFDKPEDSPRLRSPPSVSRIDEDMCRRQEARESAWINSSKYAGRLPWPREHLLGNRKDSSLALLWEAIVKDSRLKRTGDILLDQNISLKQAT
jgi:hypothetical protein